MENAVPAGKVRGELEASSPNLYYTMQGITVKVRNVLVLKEREARRQGPAYARLRLAKVREQGNVGRKGKQSPKRMRIYLDGPTGFALHAGGGPNSGGVGFGVG